MQSKLTNIRDGRWWVAKPFWQRSHLQTFIFCLVISALAGCANQQAKPDADLQSAVKVALVQLSEAEKAAYDAAVASLDGQNLSEAKAAFNDLLIKQPAMAGIYANLGIIADLEGDFDGASRYYEKALELNPAGVESLNNLAAIKIKSGSFENAKKLLERANRVDNSNTSVLLNLAMLNELYLHDLKMAKQWYERYLNLKEGSEDEDSQKVKGWLSDIERRLD